MSPPISTPSVIANSTKISRQTAAKVRGRRFSSELDFDEGSGEDAAVGTGDLSLSDLSTGGEVSGTSDRGRCSSILDAGSGGRDGMGWSGANLSLAAASSKSLSVLPAATC